jgi:hypothetical protein
MEIAKEQKPADLIDGKQDDDATRKIEEALEMVRTAQKELQAS